MALGHGNIYVMCYDVFFVIIVMMVIWNCIVLHTWI